MGKFKPQKRRVSAYDPVPPLRWLVQMPAHIRERLFLASRLAEPWMGGVAKDDPCSYCGERGETWDHIDPWHSGARNSGNITRSCIKCNGAKGGSSLLMFLVVRAHMNANVIGGLPPKTRRVKSIEREFRRMRSP